MFACVLGDGSGAKILVFGGAMKYDIRVHIIRALLVML
jgi:hypothetical protein